MRAVKYFKSRLEYALKGNGTIKVNQNDLEALNEIIEFYNTYYKNTNLEDSLILFYLLQHYRVENFENEKIVFARKPEELATLKFSNPESILRKLSMMLEPKKEIIKQITTELRAHQAYNKVPKEKAITTAMVAELLEEQLQNAKSNFPIMKELNLGEVRIIRNTI